MKSYRELTREVEMEFQDTQSAISMYAEAVIDEIDAIIESASLSSAFFTEETISIDINNASASASTNAVKTSNKSAKSANKAEKAVDAEVKAAKKSIFARMSEAISKIFKRLSELLTKGKIHIKTMEQNKKMKKTGNLVRQYCNVQIQVCDFWSYVKKIDEEIGKYIDKTDKHTIELNITKKIKDDNQINILTENITELTKAIGKNSSTFEILADTRANYEKYSKQLADQTKDLENDIKQYQSSPKFRNIVKYSTKAKADQVKIAKTQAIVTKIGPKKLNTETVTLQELWRRLMRLEPGSFPSNLAKKARRMQNELTNEKIFEYFTANENGHRALVSYSANLSALMMAYSNFYSAITDYYLNAIIKTIATFDARIPRRDELVINRG